MKYQWGGDYETVTTCSEAARTLGYAYIGLQYGGQCFMANYGVDAIGRSNNCIYECGGEPCGGPYANDVYAILPAAWSNVYINPIISILR